jgi:hypothetical protein
MTRASLLDRIRAHARHPETSTVVLSMAVGLAVFVAAAAVAARRAPPIVGVIEGVLLVIMFGAALVRARFDRGVIVILLGGLWLYLAYLGYTAYGERNYDGGPQLQYVEYIYQHHKRPPATQCLICHHPPLYYALGAIVYAFFKATRLADVTVGLQIFGLVLFLFFVAYGAKTAALLLPEKRDQRLATALFVFWPYSVHNSVRLHNDSMACALMGIASYYAVKWWKEERPRDLYLGALFTALGLLTKSSAYALVPVIFGLLALRFFRSRDKLRFVLRGALAAAILAGALVLNASGKDTPAAKNAPLCHKILGNACDIGKGQFVENKVQNYLWIDFPSFFAEPYALAERDGSGRKYFWNHLLKSSLLGTHNQIPDRETAYEMNRAVAAAMNWLLLGMVGYLALGATALRRRSIRRWAAVLLNLFSALALMVAFRALIPAPHHTDFRHIFHVVILVAIAFAATVAHFRNRFPPLAWTGRLLAVPFMALSIFYFLPKHDWAIRMTAKVVHYDIAAYGRIATDGTPWDRPANLIIEENHVVELDVKGKPKVSVVDTSFDNNDRYQIEVIGDTTWTKVVGPSRKGATGLTRYVEKVDPPVTGVHTVRVKPLSGDMAYSMGHMVVR